MKRTLLRIFSTGRPSAGGYRLERAVSLSAPTSWSALTQEQLYYVFFLMATFGHPDTVKTYMFFRFSGVRVECQTEGGCLCSVPRNRFRRRYFLLEDWQVQDMIGQMDFVDTYEGMDVRLDDICGLHAVDVSLHGVRFVDYLNAEKYFQAYIIHRDDVFLRKLARILYRTSDGDMADDITPDAAQLLGTFMWYSSVKHRFSKAFPNFFKKMPEDSTGEYDMMQAINAQVRALTDGDVTKEHLIFDTDCWRALTELDQKAREAEEYRKMMKRKK